MKYRLAVIFAAIVAIALPVTGRAHGENDNHLYVAEGGTDAGDCLDAASPCKTIGYALARAGKGGSIRVAAGTYPVASAEDIFNLVSGVVKISGGYQFGDPAVSENRAVSTLSGVPFRYREQLEDRGFRVIADRKGIDEPQAAEAGVLLDQHQRLKSSIAATPCVGGSAAGLPCSDVDLLSHVAFADVSAQPSAGNDIWGFVDLNTGREYALMGFSVGTAVFDVTDATNPREVGFVDGQAEIWRDIKVYQFFDSASGRWKAYAYVTTDGSTTDGLVVIDLTGLPHSIRRVNYPSDFLSAHNVYATNTDYSTGLSLTGDLPTLIIAGSNLANGRFREYSLADPESPAPISGASGTGYMHDASSMIISDARKDTQCINAGAWCEVLLDFNENSFEIWDISNPASPALLSNTTYANVGYVHSGWWSEDKQTLYVHDELDERDRGLPTTLRAFSLADLRNPVMLPGWTGPTNAIDHNGFVRGNRYYMSNYRRGLTVLDITDQGSPVSVGRIDTFPASDSTAYNGAWGVYPFFWSGNIAISDIDSGFYMAADRTRDVPQGSLGFTADSYQAVEGGQGQLTVSRSGGSSGAVSVAYEILDATADAADYSAATGRLDWASGDATSKTINIGGTNDGVAEPLEQLIVRLVDPRGGATLSNSNTARFYISDPGAGSVVEFDSAAVTVAERGFGTAIGVLKRTGSASGAVSVSLSAAGSATAGSDYTGTVPATVSWADGDADPKWFELAINDDGTLESNETIVVALGNPAGATIGTKDTLTVTIADADGANTAPNAIAPSSLTVTSSAGVVLDGSQSSDPNGDALTYQWRQISGPGVALTGATSANATFTSPIVQSDTMLAFTLTVTDPGGLSDTAQTNVTVLKLITDPGGGGGGAPGIPELLLMLLAVLSRPVSRRGRA